MLKEKLTSTTWWKAAAERALSQAAQSVLAVIIVTSFDAINWALAAGVAIGGAIWSLVVSLASLPETAGTNVPYWQAMAWRIVRTFAIALATAISAVAAAAADGVFNALTFDWANTLSAIGLTVFLAVVKSLVAAPAESKIPIE